MKRHEPTVGDVFAIRGTALVGRVVSTSAVVGPTHGCVLVYVYRSRDERSRDALLVPPILTTRAPWSHGTFEHLRSEPLMPGDYFETHCFRDAGGRLYDEEGRPLEEPRGPVGECRLLDVPGIESLVAH